MADNTINAVGAAMERAFALLHDKKPGEAKGLLEEETARFESSEHYKSDRDIRYCSFSEAMEEVLYQQEYHPCAEVHVVKEPVSTMYLVYGSILAGTGEIMRGQEVLRKAMQWNPVSCDILLEYAGTFRMLGSYEKYRNLSAEALRFAYLPEQAGRCLAAFGHYFELMQMWKEAAGYYSRSLACDRDSRSVRRQLAFTQEKAGVDAEKTDPEYLRKISRQYGTPLGADRALVRTAEGLGSKAQESGDEKAAHYFWDIARGLAPFVCEE